MSARYSLYEETIVAGNITGNDYFRKKYIPIQVMKNVDQSETLAEIFPNALLIETEEFQKSGGLFENTSDDKKNIKTETETEKGDIWDILDQIREKNDSETNIIHNQSDDNNTDYGKLSEPRERNICNQCGEKNSFIEDPYTNIIVCIKCGIVKDELVDGNPEWRQYNNDDTRGDTVSRCGCPSNYFFPRSSQGTIMSRCSNNRLKRKQKWNSMVYKERSLTKEFDFIHKVCKDNGIKKDIIDTAKIMYKKISECKWKCGKNEGGTIITRGPNRIGLMAICVGKACETNKEPRSNENLSKMFGINETKLTKANGKFEKIIKHCDDPYIFEQLHASEPDDYIRCHCIKLKIPKNDIDLAVRIANNCRKMKLVTDHNARSVAAGTILVMVDYCNLDIDKKDIAILSKISDVTITKIYNKIVPFVDTLVDDDATKHIIKVFHING